MARVHAVTRRRQLIVERGAHDDRRVAGLHRQDEISDELGAGLEHHDVARHSGVQDGLEVIAAPNGPRVCAGGNRTQQPEEHQENRCPQPRGLEEHVRERAKRVPAQNWQNTGESA